MAYCPRANGTAERIVQTFTRAINMYVADVDQKYRYEYAERLTFAANKAQNLCARTHSVLPDPRLGSEIDPRDNATLGSAKTRNSDPRRWRYNI